MKVCKTYEELLERIHRFGDFLIDLASADDSVDRARVKVDAPLQTVEQKTDAPDIKIPSFPMYCKAKNCPLKFGDGK